MTLEFRDHQVLVISPGSRLTQVQMGLNESLMPPAFEVPTQVFRDTSSGQFAMSAASGREPVSPVVKGAITDVPAFLYLLKVLYRSVSPTDGLPPALCLVASISWTRQQLEVITRYCFEEMTVPALTFTLQGAATAFAFALPDCLVIDIGLDKTEVSVVSGFEENRAASRVIPVGGSSVNAHLQQQLSQLTPQQIEDLKRSDIVEVLSKDQSRSQLAVQAVEEQDGVVDIAAILSSGRTREILDERERAKHGEAAEPANVEKRENQFVDSDGNIIVVGKERFTGCEELMKAIVDSMADVLYALTAREQERVFENIVFCGRGSLVQGLRLELTIRIEDRYLIHPRPAMGPEDVVGQQGPTSLTVARLPDHFPEWKNRKWEDVMFLGAQVGAKQMFTTGIEGAFVSRHDYNVVGPAGIWDVIA